LKAATNSLSCAEVLKGSGRKNTEHLKKRDSSASFYMTAIFSFYPGSHKVE
jgi:hypothetical protein